MDLQDLLENFGFPVTLCGALLFFAWKSSRWIAANVGRPLVKSHTQFLERISISMDTQAKIMVIQGETVKNIVETQKSIVDTQKNILETQEKIIDLLAETAKK